MAAQIRVTVYFNAQVIEKTKKGVLVSPELDIDI